jgi:phage terminase large subunit-like protein
MANAVVRTDPSGNRKLDKAKSSGRIDGAACGGNAFGVAPTDEGTPDLDFRQ